MSKGKLIRLFATGFGAGYSPKAPGTVGTLWGIPLFLLFNCANPFVYMLLAIGFVFFSIYIAEMHERTLNRHDSSEIIIDEIAGYLVTMVWMPSTWQALLLGFILFRVFDIWKPFPISRIDKRLGGGFGVVADDLVAGIFASIILQIIFVKTNWLGSQLFLGN